MLQLNTKLDSQSVVGVPLLVCNQSAGGTQKPCLCDFHSTFDQEV
jgi:hypothetical protein